MKNRLFNRPTFTLLLSTFLAFINNSNAQERQTAAVINVYTQGVEVSPDMAESILRIALMKTEKYNVYDRLDVLEIAKEKQINLTDCYGKNCLLDVGKSIDVDKVFTGSIENLGKKILVTIKILDVKGMKYEKTVIQEFIQLQEEIQTMVEITLNKALGIKNNPDIEEMLIYYSKPPQSPEAYIKNSGPRMGMAMVGGEFGSILSKPRSEGGFDMVPIFSQFGYQVETAYLSAGKFQALIEGLFFITGVEQNRFAPSFSLLNGFRSSKNGLEIGFGPSISFTKVAKGYYDADNTWHLQSEWINQTTYTDSLGYSYTTPNPNPYDIVDRIDSRGSIKARPSWVWAVGKTFHSGYLNIPVNAYFSYNKNGWFTGLSVGFNIAKRD